jgi:hypothetical protein
MGKKTEYQSVQMPKELLDAIRTLIVQNPRLGYRSYHEFLIGKAREGYLELLEYQYKEKMLKKGMGKNVK